MSVESFKQKFLEVFNKVSEKDTSFQFKPDTLEIREHSDKSVFSAKLLVSKDSRYIKSELEQVFYALLWVSCSETEPMPDDPYPDEDGFHIWVGEIKTVQ